jgi:hexosaminidase
MIKKLKLIPWPASLKKTGGTFELSKSIVAKTSMEGLANTFSCDLKKLGFSCCSGDDDALAIEFQENSSLENEQYFLELESSGLTLQAASLDGFFWGTRTILQLFAEGPGTIVPCLRINDKPAYEYRGCMIDVARNPHSIAFHKMMIKKLAALKMNIYHIHLTDDQSFALPSFEYPELPTPGFVHTREEYTEIVTFAGEHHVTIIPEIDMPGHASVLCEAIPELVCEGEKSGTTVCAGSEKTYEILEKIIKEAVEIFPGPYFHIGADEVFFVDGDMESLDVPWGQCPACQERIRKENLDGLKSLYHYFINRMNNIVRSCGRRTIIWEGFDLKAKPEIAKNVLVDQFENYYALPQDLLNAGYDLVNASWTPLYVACNGEFMTSPEDMAKWNAEYFGKGRAPRPFRDMVKVENNLEHVKGVCICSWTNEERMEEGLLFGTGKGYVDCGKPGPRIQVTAERAWTGSTTSAQDLLERLGLSWW